MSIKNLFNSKGTPKIQKSATSDEMVAQVESADFVESKRKQFDEFVPPIDFSKPENFAKFGSAELYYEKAFERIYQYYPYDGTLAEKVDFEISSSYLDKYVLENLYPRTNGYVNFDVNTSISIFGGPHTASAGMDGKKLDSTFDLSMKYSEEKKRTSAFEFRGEDGATIEFWLKKNGSITSGETVFEAKNNDGGFMAVTMNNTAGALRLHMKSGSAPVLLEETLTGLTIPTSDEWNHYAISISSGSAGITANTFKNGQFAGVHTSGKHIPSIIPTTSGMNATIGATTTGFTPAQKLVGTSMDEFRFWKTARTHEDIFNTWFIPVGGGTNKHDSNISLGCYFKFNEGITGDIALDERILDYSGRINNGTVASYAASFRSTGSAITTKLNEPEFKDPIIYSSHPDVVAKKAEYKTSGSLADLENSSTFFNYFPGWMQEDDEQSGDQLKYLSQVLGSYFDTLWHQISFVDKIHDHHYISGSNAPLPFSKKLLYDQGFVIPDLFSDATLIENLRQKDDNEVYEKEINEVRNTLYHNIYNNLHTIYSTKGTEKSFRNLFRSLGIGQDIVKLKLYADDSTFVLRNNYEYKSFERKFIDFNAPGHFDASIYQTTSSNTSTIYLKGDSAHTGSFSLQSEIILPKKQEKNQTKYNPFPYLSASLFGYHSGQSYTHPAPASDYGAQAYAVHSKLESSLSPGDAQRVKFVLTGSSFHLETPWFEQQYQNNKWTLAVRLKHPVYPRSNVTGASGTENEYVLDFHGVEADGNTKRNSFNVSTSGVNKSFFSSDKIFYAGAHKTNFRGSTTKHTDIKLGYLRYWHSFLSNDAIDQHAYDSETFGTNEPFEQDLVDVYEVEIPREKTLSFHWAFNDLTTTDSSGEITITDLSSGSADLIYGDLSPTIQNYIAGYGIGFNQSTTKVLDKNYLFSARKRLPDDLMSSDLTTIKSDETEIFFVDDDVSDNFYSFEKSLYGTISDEMMNLFSTALDLNNLIGQPNQKYHHRYNLADFLRDRFYDDVENEPDIEKFTSFYKWIDDSISIAVSQLIPASTRFSEKINNVIESHVLERSKYVHQVPILTRFESTEGSIKGVSELKYDWQFGHAPLKAAATGTVTLSNASIGNFYNTVIRIVDGHGGLKRYIIKNVATSDTGTTVSLNPGSGAVDHVVVGVQGLTYETAVNQLVIAIESTNGHHGKIEAINLGGGVLSLKQSAPGELGNSTIIAQQTYIDGSTLWSNFGIGSTSGFTGGDDKAATQTLWRKERESKSGLRETIRNSKNNNSIQSSGLIRRDVAGSTRVSDAYEVRKFSKTYDLSLTAQKTIHGGTNFGRRKNIQLFHESIAPAGLESPGVSGVPQNVLTVGVGTGQAIMELTTGDYDKDNPPRKRKIHVEARIGNRSDLEYGYNILGDFVLPMNIMSGSVKSGVNLEVDSRFREGTYFTNLHNDIVGNTNEIPMQGPFTEQHVGGVQYRHIDLNQYGENGLANQDTRPEGWALLIKEHPVSPGSDDGAFGFVGPDYRAPYPARTALKATRFRDEHAKRPINIRNIKTISGSWKVGNYKNELEIFQISPTFQKTWAVEAQNDPNIDILPPFISTPLPNTTHYQTLMGIAPFDTGNIFGVANNNRQPDTTNLILSPAIAGASATGSFSMYPTKFTDDDDKLTFSGLQSAGQTNYGIELDAPNNGAATSGHLPILTGSSDSDLWDNTKTALQTLGFTVNTSSVGEVSGSSFIFPNEGNSSGYVFMTASSGHTFGTAAASNPFSISMWYRKPSGTPIAQGYLFNFMSSSYGEQTAGNTGVSAAAYIDSSERLFFYVGGKETSGGGGWTQNFKRYDTIIGTGSVGDWNQLILVFDGGTALTDFRAYCNGIDIPESATGNLMQINGNSPVVGRRDGHVRFFNALATSSGKENTELKNLHIGDTAYFETNLNATQAQRVFHRGYLVDLTQSSFSSFNLTSWYTMGAHPSDLIDIKTATATKLFLKDTVGSNDLGGEKTADNRVVTSSNATLVYPSHRNFFLTGSVQHSMHNGMGGLFGSLPAAFFDVTATAGGITPVPADSRFSNDNVITIPRLDLTGSERNIQSRFSAPGGPEVQSIGYLDAYTSTFSAHNAMPFRNLSVLGSGSGESTTIRVQDHLNQRRGLKTLRTLHMGQFGIDPEYGQITSPVYPTNGSFNKQHRNRSRAYQYSSGELIITGSNYDNMHINSSIPRSEIQYSWIHHASTGTDVPEQRILGYAPKSGIVSSSAGYVEAVIFPTISTIRGA